jgi:hypothetical protein
LDEYSTNKKHTSKAQEMEDVLTNALSMAERNSGSLLWYHQTSKTGVVEMGRSISKLKISKVQSMEGEEQTTTGTAPNINVGRLLSKDTDLLEGTKGRSVHFDTKVVGNH